MPALIDSLPRFYVHLLSLPEAHYAGTCASDYSCPVAYWLSCETDEWIHVRVGDTAYFLDASARPRKLPLWAELFVRFVDSRRWAHGRYMTREECLDALASIERELSRRLLPERAESRVERAARRRNRSMRTMIDTLHGRVYAISPSAVSVELADYRQRV